MRVQQIINRKPADLLLVFGSALVNGGAFKETFTLGPDGVASDQVVAIGLRDKWGHAATQHFRARETEQQLPRTPIVAMTAAAGMDEYLSQPIKVK